MNGRLRAILVGIGSLVDLSGNSTQRRLQELVSRHEYPSLAVAFCGRDDTHVPHWHGEYHDEWCRGGGLAGVCEHGVGMLDACEACDAATFIRNASKND